MHKRLLLKNFNKKGDYLLIIAVIILAVVGMVFIYSASSYSAQKTYSDGFYFVKKQAQNHLLSYKPALAASIKASIAFVQYLPRLWAMQRDR